MPPEAFTFTQDDIERFERINMNPSVHVAEGYDPQEIAQLAIELEQEGYIGEPLPTQAPPPIVAPTDRPEGMDRLNFGDVKLLDLINTGAATFYEQIGGGAGFLIQKGGEYIGNDAIAQGGKYIQELVGRASTFTRDLRSEQTKRDEMRSLAEFKHPDDLIPSGMGNWNLNTIANLVASGGGSTIGPLSIGRWVGKGVQALGASPTLAGIAGLTVGASGIEGTNAARQAHNSTMEMSLEEVKASPLFQAAKKAVLVSHPNTDDDSIARFAQQRVANQVAIEVGVATGSLIGATSFITGGFLGRLGLS